MSYKRLFTRSLDAAPGRLHLAAHSHHLWPDASFLGQMECWTDAARLADAKWDRILGEIWPEAQARVAAELGEDVAPHDIVFASNTHELLIRLVAACPRKAGQAIRILTSDGEFHSAQRQFDRWEETGEAVVQRLPVAPFDDFGSRFLSAAHARDHDLIFVSQVMFVSGRIFAPVADLAALSRPEGPWVAIDGYHSFMALERPFPPSAPASAFFLGGGYKYAMAGEGCAFLYCPPGFGPRPPITGWYAAFKEIGSAAGDVGYAPDARRFLGATFDSSGLYRFVAIQRMLAAEALNTAAISAWVAGLQERLLEAIRQTPLSAADLLNPLDAKPHARFLAFRSTNAPDWCDALRREGCMTDVRGDVLRIGLGLYHNEDDVDQFARLARALT